VRLDDQIVDNRVLESPQVMIECDDVFLEPQATSEIDPPFVVNHFARGDGEPVMKPSRVAN
jgi:hypothetical protein